MRLRLLSLAAAAALALTLASCGGGDSSAGESSSGGMVVNVARNDKLGYDISDREGRLFYKLRDKYKDGYKLTCTADDSNGGKAEYVFEVKGERACVLRTVSGMLTRKYRTAEGELYDINEGSTTYEYYTAEEAEEKGINNPSDFDPLFGETDAFYSASIDEDTGDVTEAYKLSGSASGATLSFIFDGETGEVKSIFSTVGGEEYVIMNDIVITAPDEQDLEVPDLSEYKKNN